MSSFFHLTSTDYRNGESYAIIQGSTFDRVVFWYPGDVSGFVPRGQIKTDYAQKGGELITSFQFHPLRYERRPDKQEAVYHTKIHPFLTAQQTQALIFNLRTRRSNLDKASPGRNCWVYDIELARESDGYVIQLSKGYVEVELEVTR